MKKANLNGKDDEYLRATLWAGPAVSAGLPSTNVPIGMSSKNLPIGMQITGPYLEDKLVSKLLKLFRFEVDLKYRQNFNNFRYIK